MGKTEKGTPKDIANRMKAKGLQKLRWYCQMCQKQCRDENGFKCHTMSESHQRQLLLFAEDPDKYLDSFSQEFLDGYVGLLKRQFGTKRVHANNVYQEYIHDRHHIHMNATQWETLTDFVKWLGREGMCHVDETEKGWYVAYIDRDPETILRQEKAARREKHEKDQEDRLQEFISHQIELGKSKGSEAEEKFSNLKREGDSTITLSLNLASSAKVKKMESVRGTVGFAALDKRTGVKVKYKKSDTKPVSALAEIIEEETQQKKLKADLQQSRLDKEVPWLAKGIVVKVITKDLGSKYYKEKGMVMDILSIYCAIVRLNECGTKLKLDQTHLETVIPAIGREVLMVMGDYRGRVGILQSLQPEKFSAVIRLTKDGVDEVVEGVPYEHFSKLYKQ